jgi:hypothetical protein
VSTAAIDRVERLARAIEAAPESTTRAVALELIQATLTLHGEGLQRILAILNEQGQAGEKIIRLMATDQLISSLLSLHDLHPDSLRLRVERALLQLQDTIANHGVEAHLRGVSEEGVVAVRLNGPSHGTKRVHGVIEDALFAVAPDAVEIVFEGEPWPGFVPLSSLVSNNAG